MNIVLISCGVAWFLLGGTCMAALTYRRRLALLEDVRRMENCTRAEDLALASWARDTKITVNTVTGTWISMTMRELAASSVQHRAWNVPTSVEIHPRSVDVRRDQADQAKEHRG